MKIQSYTYHNNKGNKNKLALSNITKKQSNFHIYSLIAGNQLSNAGNSAAIAGSQTANGGNQPSNAGNWLLIAGNWRVNAGNQ